MEEFKHDVFVTVLLDKFPFDGVGIIPVEKSSKGFEIVSQEIEFLSSGLNLVVYMMDIHTGKKVSFPWIIINGKSYSNLDDFRCGFSRGESSQMNREKDAAKARGEKQIENY